MNDNRKPVFTALAELRSTDSKEKKLALLSPQHWQQQVNKLLDGKKYGITVEEYKASRSQNQLRYYWVILGYLANYSGYAPEELHDAIMRQKFGVKKVKVGDIEETVRKSISNAARFNKSDMVELIDEVLNICIKVGVVVPTKEELGYL